jgi:hypothetical protein
MTIFFQWLFAHLAADFLLQTSKMVAHKKRLRAGSWLLYLHCVIHAILIYVLTPGPRALLIAGIVGISHYLIDLWKLYQKEKGIFFVIDQTLHVLVLVILWIIFYGSGHLVIALWKELSEQRSIWIIACGYILISFPLSFLLGFWTARWRKEVEEKKSEQARPPLSSTSLSEAGKWIGIFERILVYTFVITNHFEGIGFLIAAKSILRFNDIKGEDARREAEYVLIGTLMSFSSSIMAGLVTRLIIPLSYA